jgi:hypothetical protein
MELKNYFPCALLALGIGILLPCSFDSSPRFLPRAIPEQLNRAFLQGQLGLLTPSLLKRYELVAWRYLSGQHLDPSEQQAFLPKPANSSPSSWQQWQEARNATSGIQPRTNSYFNPSRESRVSPGTWYENCLDNSVTTATQTLRDRRTRYADPALLRDWIEAQDRVFSHCERDTDSWPAEPTPSMPVLAREDRRYQIAAAHFYAENLDEAEKRFREIAASPASPWQATAAYMTARTLIRQYSLLRKAESLQKANDELALAIGEPAFTTIRPDLIALRQYTQNLLHPETVFDDLSRSLALPHPGPGIAKTVDEAAWLMSVSRFHSAYEQSTAPAFEWVRTLEADDATLPLKRWRDTHSGEWLTLAIMKAKPDDESANDLVTAALAVPEASPAYDTVRFHAIRLITQQGDRKRARTLLDKLLAGKGRTLSSVDNAFRAQRMALATSFEDMLRWAPRRPIGFQDEELFDPDQPDDVPAFPILDRDSTEILNRFTPLSKLASTARRSSLPLWIRQNLALATWTRAFMLTNEPVADEMTPILATAHPKWEGDLTAFRSATGAERRFVGALLIARHAEFYPDMWSDFRGQSAGPWWCSAKGNPNPVQPTPAEEILSSAEKAAAVRDLNAIATAGSAQTAIAPAIFNWAKIHPDDPRVPEALHRLVRITRYGCRIEPENGTVSKQAFELLHNGYPKSTWTAQTPYWFK